MMKGKVIFDRSYKSLLTDLSLIKRGPANATWESLPLHEEVKGEVIIECIKNTITKVDSSKVGPSKDVLCAYDESILELNTLEGVLRCITHCSVLQTDRRYFPSGFVSLKYFTSSSKVSDRFDLTDNVFQTSDLAKSMNEHYIAERLQFLSEWAPSESVIFIDGSLFSGASTSGNFQLVKNLLKRDTYPIFFVKNSSSTIIRDNYEQASGYHNDLHWAYSTLKEGEMSPLFQYQSKDKRTKIIGFLKVFNNRSPIRIEFPGDAYLKGLYPANILETIYYQYLANGFSSNVQPKIIQVAELYAREILKSTNLYSEVEKLGLIKTMNEERF